MRSLFLSLLAGSLLSCSTSASLATATGRSAASLPLTELVYQQPTTIGLQPGTQVQATLTEVSDSRCPADVQCITAGYVAVSISLAQGKAEAISLHLCLGCNARNQPNTTDSVAVTLNQKPYWARLLAVRPAPASPGNIPAPVATLRLRLQ